MSEISAVGKSGTFIILSQSNTL